MGIPPIVGHADRHCDLIECHKAADCERDVMLGIISLHLLGAGNLLAPWSSSTAGWGCKCKCTRFHQQLLVDVQELFGIKQRETRGGNRRWKKCRFLPQNKSPERETCKTRHPAHHLSSHLFPRCRGVHLKYTFLGLCFDRGSLPPRYLPAVRKHTGSSERLWLIFTIHHRIRLFKHYFLYAFLSIRPEGGTHGADLLPASSNSAVRDAYGSVCWMSSSRPLQCVCL